MTLLIGGIPTSHVILLSAAFFSSIDRFNSEPQAPGFVGTRRTYFHIDYITVDAVTSSFAALASLALHRVSPFSVHNDSFRKVHTKRAEIRNYLMSNELWLRDCAIGYFSRTGGVEISTNAEISAAKIETVGSVIRVAVLLRPTRKLPRDGNQRCHSCLASGRGQLLSLFTFNIWTTKAAQGLAPGENATDITSWARFDRSRLGCPKRGSQAAQPGATLF